MDATFWDTRYAGKALVWTAEPNRFLVSELTGLAPGRALDLACGEGRNTVWLAEQGWDATGLDFSEEGLKKARALAEQRGVEAHFECVDLGTWRPEPRSWDLVVLMYLHIPWDLLEPILATAADAVAPGGTLLLVGHDETNPENGYGGPQDSAVLYGPEAIAGALPGLHITKAERVRREVKTDTGEAAAIDCLVRAERR